MLYVDPAPVSSFEAHLGPPGLQSLFRRHSSVVAGTIRHGENCLCCYSAFGDDLGIDVARREERATVGLPSVHTEHA